MSDAIVREDVFRDTIDSAQFGVVEKPLSTWERVYNQAAVRKHVAALQKIVDQHLSAASRPPVGPLPGPGRRW